MEKLNELEMLAKFADKEVTWSLLPFDIVKDGWCVEVVDYIAAMMPANILAIAEAFRSLEQRAEAAEHERDCHMDIAEHFKTRCKELEQQKPYGYVHNLVDPPGGGVAASIFKEESRHYGRPVFTRPAPAIKLAELVPDERFVDVMSENMDDVSLAEDVGFNRCRAAIMRNIEEAK